MNVRILFTLVCLFVVVSSCKKDKTPKKRAVRGTVLHIADHSPIAGVEVSTPAYLFALDTTRYRTYTDAQGKFSLELPVDYNGFRVGFDYSRKNMATCYLNGFLPAGWLDTTYMDEASYLRIVTNAVAPPGGREWTIGGYFVFADNPPPAIPPTKWFHNNDTLWYMQKSYKGAISNDTVVVAYSHRLFKAGGAALVLGTDLYAQKPLTLLHKDTVKTTLSY